MTESSQLLSSSCSILQSKEEPSEGSELGKESDGASEIIETYSESNREMMETNSESNSTAISQSKEGGGAGGVTRAEPLSAKQQVALWLTRTSTQEIYSELTMSNIKSWVYPHPETRRKQPLCGPSRQDMHRNFSTKSLLEGSHCNYYEDQQDGARKNLIRKCETVLALSEESQESRPRVSKAKSKSKASLCTSRMSLFKRPASKCGSEIMTSQAVQPFPGIRPTNRLRSRSSVLQCSRCASVISMSASRVNSRPSSQMSLLLDKKFTRSAGAEKEVQCKICLYDCPQTLMVKIEDCGCAFCKDCLRQYITFEVMEGAYDISCPDPNCPSQGVLNQTQMEILTDKQLMEKHRTFRLNTEVSLDANRTWCPSAGCDTICHICTGSKSQGVPVTCPTCVKEFCSLCSANWHPGLSCAENGAFLVKQGGEVGDLGMWIGQMEGENIKRCPMCAVPIERDAGCAQMMCKRCKHVFCWYCLISLDDDFLLRHYDSGECQGKLGHSRLSVILHRAQVIGIFAGFAILLLVASPDRKSVV